MAWRPLAVSRRLPLLHNQATLSGPLRVRFCPSGLAPREPTVRGLLIANINNLPFEVKLVPRTPAKEQDQGLPERVGEHGEYAPQFGAPYGMFRRPLLSPGNLPCVPHRGAR
jgi:hypothetical protein